MSSTYSGISTQTILITLPFGESDAAIHHLAFYVTSEWQCQLFCTIFTSNLSYNGSQQAHYIETTYIEDLTRVVISYEINETSLRSYEMTTSVRFCLSYMYDPLKLDLAPSK